MREPWQATDPRPTPNRHCISCEVLWAGANRCWVCGRPGRLRGVVETMVETLAWAVSSTR